MNNKLYILIENALTESLSTQRKKYGNDFINSIKDLDPSSTYKYIDQIQKFINEGHSKKEVEYYIQQYNNNFNKLDNKYKDINNLTFEKLKEIINNNIYKQSNSKIFDNKLQKECYYKTINNYNIYKPETKEESIELGKGTNWCISYTDAPNEFDDYFWSTEYNVDFYILINKTNQHERYQIAVYPNNITEIYDSSNNFYDMEDLYDITHIDSSVFKWNKYLNGYYKITNKKNQVIKEVYYKNNKLNGEYKEYYENGQIKIEQYYSMNNKDGKNIEYHENGNKKTECNYINGKLNGKYIKYRSNGIPLEILNYKNNELDGEQMLVNNEGKSFKKWYIKNGKQIND